MWGELGNADNGWLEDAGFRSCLGDDRSEAAEKVERNMSQEKSENLCTHAHKI